MKRLNEAERNEIILQLSTKKPPSKRSLARSYNVSEGAIRKVWLNKDNIQNRSALMSEKTKKTTFRSSVGRHPELEEKLFQWIEEMRRVPLPVPPMLVIQKAKSMATDMSIEGFKASWQWLHKFRQRKGIKSVMLHGEGAEVDKENPELLHALSKLYEKISKYEPENVYNMDETGLFFRLLPRYSMLLPNENVDTTRGKKKSKDRISLVVCANATGTHKIPCTVIGKPKRPACIRNREWPVKYFNQSRAWMDVATCWKWFDEVFQPEINKRTGRPVLLLMDNAPGHFEAFNRKNIEVAFFPANCTSWKQPCDMGIIAALKKRYKYLYLKEVLTYYEMDDSLKSIKAAQGKQLSRGAAGVAYGNAAHLLDAANIVKESWDAISAETIRNSFTKTEIMNRTPVPVEITTLTPTPVENSENEWTNEIISMFARVSIEIDVNEVVNFEKIDEENTEEYIQEILEDVDDVLEEVPDERPLSDDSDIEDSLCPTKFAGFDNLCMSAIGLENQLLCPDVRDAAGADYSKLLGSFENFQKTLTKIASNNKTKKKVQLTLHDMFINNSYNLCAK
jgi:hypothetical protein